MTAQVLHAVLVLAALFALAYAVRVVARLVRQPVVFLEIVVGLAVGPLILAVGGTQLRDTLLPAAVLEWVTVVGQVGLALFLIGVGHDLHTRPAHVGRRAVGWASAGGFLVPLAIGAGFAVWVLTAADPGLRGSAPTPALVLLLSVSLAVTAVPVLARILDELGVTDTHAGRMAMVVAVIIDAGAWLIVALAVGLVSGGSGGVSGLAGVLVASVLGMAGTRRLLRTEVARRWCARFPRVVVLLAAAGGVIAFATMESWGLTGAFGAILVGFAIPADGPDGAWQRVVAVLARGGRLLVPVFFVVTGITVFATGLGPVSWFPIVLATVLAVCGKVCGGYVGSRLGGQSHRDGLRLGVLLNARGMTELVVLQAGYVAGILTPAMFMTLLVMALVTTAMTRPAYALVERMTSTRRIEQPANGRSGE